MKNLVLENYSDEAKDIIKIADDFYNQVIKFDMKWDMERCTKEYKFFDEIDWFMVPFKDEEWTYMLNRHKHFIVYGQAYLITNNKKYVEKFKEEITHWIDNIKLENDENLLAWRSIEVGLRLRNWVKSLEYFIEDIDFDFLEKIIMSMLEQVEYIVYKSRDDRFLSNWVILENHGLFIASSFLSEFKGSREKSEFSIKYINKALEMQILADGMHWEQSYMYHNEMINCILSVIITAERNNKDIPIEIKNKVIKMLYGTLSIMQPNYMQPNYGDSDIEDVRDILSFGAVVFNDGILKNLVGKLPINILFDIGIDGYEKFMNIEKQIADFTSISLNDCGNYIIRDRWGTDGIFTLFKCGALGSGHGHFDLLHFNINYKGIDILVDSGRYNYAENNEFRVKLKEAKSHNTFILDNEEFNKANGSWSTLKVSEAIKREHKFGKLASFVEGAHLGYIMKGAFVNRKIVFLNKGIWLISDEIRSTSNHEYKSFFNFGSKNIEKKDGILKYKVNLNNGKDNTFNIVPLDNQNMTIEKSYISEQYNNIRESKKAVFTKKFLGDADFNYIMYMDDIDDVKNIEYIPILDWRGKRLEDMYSKAIKIDFINESYIIVKVFKEEPKGRKTYTVDGIQIYGRVVVIKKDEKSTEVEVLNF